MSSLSSGPVWFTHTLDEAKVYGKYAIEYELVQDVVLLNPINANFHNDYLSKLNNLYTGTANNGVDENKIQASLPFGLPNYDAQVRYLRSKNVKLIDVKEWNVRHDHAIEFIHNKHRYSDFSRDIFLVTNLKTLYGDKYHGYMTNIMWPSKLHDGFFGRELCLFAASALVKSPRIIQFGGTRKIKQIDGPVKDTWNRMNDPRLTPELWNSMVTKIGLHNFKRLGITPPNYT